MDGTRRSSLFEVNKTPAEDPGSSSLSLSEIPSVSKRAQRMVYENTFKIEPDRKCEVSNIKPMIEQILEDIFGSQAYDPYECGLLCKKASTAIKDAVKQLRMERYKYVVTVTCSQNVGQGVKQASRFLWDANRDNWVDATFTNTTLQAQAVLYALYYE
ncbi:dynein light chain Tctex-type 5-like [Clytia hemisphaerica]